MRIIPRAEWGARYPNGGGSAPLPARECWLHHSVTIAPDLVPPFDDDYAAVRALEEIGQQRFGQGISYTWLVTPAGLVFEGHSPDRLGAHTAGRNSIARAICLVGNYDTVAPTTAQLRAVAWLLQQAHTAGWLDERRLDGGHRDLKATACPGAHAYAAISGINRLAAGPPITDLEDDMDAKQADQLQQIYDVLARAFLRTGRTAGDLLADTEARLARLEAKHDTLATALGDDEAKVIAAVRGLQLGQVDVPALAAVLVPLLPPQTTPQQVADAVADEQARRLAG